MTLNPSCLFCKIVSGQIPCFKLFENDLTLAFLDIGPLSKGHVLVIPKFHGEFLHDIPDANLADLLPVSKKIINAFHKKGSYNVLQNNGQLAHQAVPHVHFHLIPKPNEDEGLKIEWNSKNFAKEEMAKLTEEIKSKIA